MANNLFGRKEEVSNIIALSLMFYLYMCAAFPLLCGIVRHNHVDIPVPVRLSKLSNVEPDYQ